MANRDNPNGFTFVRSLGGEAVILTETCGATALKKGDAVYLASAVLTVLADTSAGVYGIMAADCDANAQGKFYPALPTYVFEAQCDSAQAYDAATYSNLACNKVGTTGIMELQLADSGQDQFLVWKLADQLVHGVTNTVGANARLYCTIFQSQFLGMKGTATVHA